MPRKSWYDIQAAADVPEILIYNDIGSYGVSDEAFVMDLAKIKAKDIKVRISSRGGDVFQGVAIFNALSNHSAQVHVQVDSLAASIASLIAMAGDKISMAKNSRMMIHEAWTIAAGNARELNKTADVLGDLDTIIIDTYSARTGMAKKEIRKMMEDETWMNPKTAKEMGFIDEIMGESNNAQAAFDLSIFKNVPDEIKQAYAAKRDEPATERELEQLLRDAGVSNSRAKLAVAAIKGDHRDDESLKDAISTLSAKIQMETLIQKFKGA